MRSIGEIMQEVTRDMIPIPFGIYEHKHLGHLCMLESFVNGFSGEKYCIFYIISGFLEKKTLKLSDFVEYYEFKYESLPLTLGDLSGVKTRDLEAELSKRSDSLLQNVEINELCHRRKYTDYCVVKKKISELFGKPCEVDFEIVGVFSTMEEALKYKNEKYAEMSIVSILKRNYIESEEIDEK